MQRAPAAYSGRTIQVQRSINVLCGSVQKQPPSSNHDALSTEFRDRESDN